MSLAQRSVRSTTYNILASGIQTVVQFARSILLARLLAPEEFGIYTYVVSFIVLTKDVPSFGMGAALIHRARESEGELALRVHFTLSLIFNLIWGFVIALIGFLFIGPESFWVLWIILATQVIDNLTQTGKFVLAKRVLFGRIAVINTLVTISGSVTAVVLAWQGLGIWSLVSTDIIAALIPVIGFYIYKPPWWPRLGWSSDVASYFLDFGRRSFLASLLRQALDNVDDLWAGTFLGETRLGFYSRAYTFATYPRRVLASPLNMVVTSTYAELKGKRKRLSQAFFRVNSFLIRTGFLFAGLLALVAPEFIRLVIGVKWLPMLDAFRLMLIYTMLDPIKVTISNIFIAVGEPEKVVRARSIQLGILIAALFTLGPRWDIAGVALAADIMLVVGIILLLWQAREHVDFSLRQMFIVPTLALGIGLVIARAAILIPGVLGSPWRTGTVKTIVFCFLYGLIVLTLERKQIPMMLNMLKQLRRSPPDKNKQPKVAI